MRAEAVRALQRHIQDTLPPVDFALGYGSAVFAQRGHDARGAMRDAILGVSCAAAWHAANMRANAAHYPAGVRAFPGVLRALHGCGGRVVYLWDAGARVKYGVVQTAEALDALRTWRPLFLPGRLHKPVAVLSCGRPEMILDALDANRRHALNAALLLLPLRFTLGALLREIVALSYAGDIRAGIAEDPRKVERILHGQAAELIELYAPLIHEEIVGRRVAVDGGAAEQSSADALLFSGQHSSASAFPALDVRSSSTARGKHDAQVVRTQSESTIALAVHSPTGNDATRSDLHQPSVSNCDAFKALSTRLVQDASALTVSLRLARLPPGVSLDGHGAQSAGRVPEAVRASLARLVRWPSAVQALSGVVTAGALGSLAYLARKVGRRFS